MICPYMIDALQFSFLLIGVSGDTQTNVQMGISNCWTGIWNRTVNVHVAANLHN